MEVRKTKIEEIDLVMDIYELAREFMKKTGNANQWINGYPSRRLIEKDIQDGYSYVCIIDGEISGTFFFMQGEEPTYSLIYEGEWLNSRPYGVIHRMAGNGKAKGIGAFCLNWCFTICNNIRIDTHHDNKVMQNILERDGYTRCGIIYLADGSPRIAYHRSEDFTHITDGIIRVIQSEELFLNSLTEEEITSERNIQNRNIKQILGHLIDSASNNHQRMVRLQYNKELSFPDYRQDNDLWISIQNYEKADWKSLIQLWKFYNLHIAHVISSVDITKLENFWLDFEGTKVTLKNMIEGYLDHLHLHIREIHELAPGKPV